MQPEFDIMRIKSFFVTAPTSPCKASLGCIKKEGLPVLEKVADNFLAMCPDFPIPIITNFPLHLWISLQKRNKSFPIDLFRLFMAVTSELITFRANFRASI